MIQENLFDVAGSSSKFDKLLKDVQESARRIVAELEYPDGCVGIAVNKILNETNYPLQIRERRRSAATTERFGEETIEAEDKNGVQLSYVCTPICTFALTKPKSKFSGCVEIRLNVASFNAVEIPKAESVKERMTAQSNSADSQSEKVISRYDVLVKLDSEELLPYIENLIRSRLLSYRSTEPTYGCCHLFNECSSAKKCVSKDKIYSTVCSYRKNLEAGRIFYGENKTI